MQAAALLQMTGSKADSRHVESLTQQLSQASGDLQMVTSQLHASLQESVGLVGVISCLSVSCIGPATEFIEVIAIYPCTIRNNCRYQQLVILVVAMLNRKQTKMPQHTPALLLKTLLFTFLT